MKFHQFKSLIWDDWHRGKQLGYLYVYLEQWMHSVQFSRSVVSDSSDTMDHSTPGFPVHHQLLEFTQTHLHWIGDAIQPSHPLSSLSPPAFNLSQHQGIFKWVLSSHQVAKVSELQLQHRSLQWIYRTDSLSNGLVGSPCSPRDSQEPSPTPQFKNINSSALSFLHSPTLTSIHDHWEKQQSTGMSCSWLRRDQPFRFSIVQYRWKTDFMWRGVNSMKILNDCSYHTLGSTLVS